MFCNVVEPAAVAATGSKLEIKTPAAATLDDVKDVISFMLDKWMLIIQRE
jgi:hypothetical protein